MPFKTFDGATFTATRQPSSREAEALEPLDIKFGQNLSLLMGLQSVSYQLTEVTGNVLAIIDTNGSTFWEGKSTNGNTTLTSEQIWDLGFIAPTRVINLIGSYSSGDTSDVLTLKLYTSLDGINFTERDSSQKTDSPATERFFDPLIATEPTRFVKIEFIIEHNAASSDVTIRLYQLGVFV